MYSFFGEEKGMRNIRPIELDTVTDAQVQRFWDTVAPGDLGACWSWPKCVDRSGYGHVFVGEKKRKTNRCVKAHRLAYTLLRGEIGDGLVVDHVCKNRKCVNPWHLEQVRQGENLARGATNTSKTHCPQGHEYTEENTYNRSNGNRSCKVCGRARDRVRVKKKNQHRA